MKSRTRFVAAILAIAAISGCSCVQNAGSSEKEKWQALFNGKDLTGWVQRGGKARFFVEDGILIGQTVPKTPNSFLCTEKHYSNFILELDFKVDPELNSGVQIRSHSLPDYRKGRVHGYQVEIDPSMAPYEPNPEKKRPANLMADGKPAPADAPRCWTGGIYDEGRRGWLYSLHKDPTAREAFKPGKWNHIRVEAIGDSIKTWVNGIAAADLKDSMTPSGFIGLQVHGLKKPVEKPLQVRFRNIRIKDLGGN